MTEDADVVFGGLRGYWERPVAPRTIGEETETD